MKRIILLIDDDELCRLPAAEALRGLQWTVIEAEDGEHGMELALRHRPDVIVCDLLMPRTNGFQVCRGVREHLELRHTKIIVVSARDYPADRQSASEAGADQYIVKPLDPSRLRGILAEMFPASPDGASPEPDGATAEISGTGTLVRFWGVRGSIPTPGPTTVHVGGNTSCVEVRADGELIILDAGTGIRPLGESLAREFGREAISLTVLVTHTHWDHIQGFPFFLPAYNARNRLRILGYEGARAGLAATLAGQMESPYFPIALKQMPGNIVIEELREMHFFIGAVRVEACFSNHPGVCVGYRLFTSKGSVAYFPDNETSMVGPSGSNGADRCALETKLIEFVRGSDVLIIDSQYDCEEYRAHVGWGHGCVDDVVRLAVAANVEVLFLFHHDPSHDDVFIEKLLEHAREVARESGGGLRVEAAREGEKITLRAQKEVAGDS